MSHRERSRVVQGAREGDVETLLPQPTFHTKQKDVYQDFSFDSGVTGGARGVAAGAEAQQSRVSGCPRVRWGGGLCVMSWLLSSRGGVYGLVSRPVTLGKSWNLIAASQTLSSTDLLALIASRHGPPRPSPLPFPNAPARLAPSRLARHLPRRGEMAGTDAARGGRNAARARAGAEEKHQLSQVSMRRPKSRRCPAFYWMTQREILTKVRVECEREFPPTSPCRPASD